MKPIIAVAALNCLVLAACGNVNGADLIFGQQEAVGLTISGSAPQQGGGLTLGYHSLDIAVVPVVVETPDGAKVVKGETKSLDDQGDSAGGLSDALSTIGQFDLDTGTAGTVSAGLQKFFATGNAAQILAQGFAEKMGAATPAAK
ncbi:MAG: hypothetical protein NXI18_00065 [Alphaproteobacteria bacterium]|nr:hypothetical protein [Alphaproteobacteria bacterium]